MKVDWNLIINIATLLFVVTAFFIDAKRRKAWWIPGFLLGETQESFEAIMQSFNASNNTIIIINEDSIIVSINKTVERMFLWKDTEVKGKSVTLLMPDRFTKLHLAAMGKSKAKMHEGFVERKVRLFGKRKDGTEFPMDLELKKNILKGKIGFIGIVQDVSKEVDNQNILKTEVEKLYTKLKLLECGEEILKCGSWSWNISTKMVRISKGCQQIFDLDSEEVNIKEMLKNIWLKDKQLVNDEMQKSFTGTNGSIEFRTGRRDGSAAQVIATWQPVMEKGVMTKLNGTVEQLKILENNNAGYT